MVGKQFVGVLVGLDNEQFKLLMKMSYGVSSRVYGGWWPVRL